MASVKAEVVSVSKRGARFTQKLAECLGFCTQLANRLYLYTDDWKLKVMVKH